MKVLRILIIEGPENWVRTVLEKGTIGRNLEFRPAPDKRILEVFRCELKEERKGNNDQHSR